MNSGKPRLSTLRLGFSLHICGSPSHDISPSLCVNLPIIQIISLVLMADNANALYRKAEGKLSKKSGFLGIFSSVHYDEAQELFVQAANQYKIAKMWKEAGESFERASFCSKSYYGPGGNEEAQLIVEAAECFQRIPDKKQAMNLYMKAEGLYAKNGKYQQSGKLLNKAAADSEQDGDLEIALELYKRSADMFELDNFGKSNYTQAILKFAELATLLGRTKEAVKIFEEEGKKASTNNLLQYGAKEHFFKALLILISEGEALTCQLSFEKYCAVDNRLETSREGKFVQEIVGCIEKDDAASFGDLCQKYDAFSKLDTFKLTLLNKGKAHLGQGPGQTSEPAATYSGDLDELL